MQGAYANASAFVAKVDTSGTGSLLWSTTFGASDGPPGLHDELHALALAEDGNSAYVAGSTAGVVSGYDAHTKAFNASSSGGTDGILAQVDAATGSVLWSRQLGSGGDDVFRGVAVD